MDAAAAAARESPAAPERGRLASLDLVRGVAVLGILAANFPSFSAPSDLGLDQGLVEGWTDRAVVLVTLLAVIGKFMTLFALLFGAGLALQFDRAGAATSAGYRRFALYYLRRQAVLFLIGLAHGLLLWFGDILAAYAVVGCLALPLARLRPPALLRCAGALIAVALLHLLLALAGVALLAALGVPLAGGEERKSGGVEEWRNGRVEEAGPSALPLIHSSTPPLFPLPPAALAGLDEIDRAALQETLRRFVEYASDANQLRIYRHSAFGEMVLHRAACLAVAAALFWCGLVYYLLGCFLLGIHLLRRGVFHDPGAHRPFLRRLAVGGMAVALPLELIAALLYMVRPEGAGGLPAQLLVLIAALPLALVYLVLLLHWPAGGRPAGLPARLRAVGRLALTNYLGQSLVCTTLFYGYGLALYGRVNRVEGLAVIAAIWLFQLVASPLWLRRFRMGPVEWLWRRAAGNVKRET